MGRGTNIRDVKNKFMKQLPASRFVKPKTMKQIYKSPTQKKHDLKSPKVNLSNNKSSP
jgi:hypothetical protein